MPDDVPKHVDGRVLDHSIAGGIHELFCLWPGEECFFMHARAICFLE